MLLKLSYMFAGHFSEKSRDAAVLWLACHDTDAANAELAHKLTSEAGICFPLDYISPLADALSQDSSDIRQAAADALATGMKASFCNGFSYSCSVAHCSTSAGVNVSINCLLAEDL